MDKFGIVLLAIVGMLAWIGLWVWGALADWSSLNPLREQGSRTAT